MFGKYGIEHTYVEMDDLDAVKAAIKPNTKMFFVETPTNPMMKVADIQALTEKIQPYLQPVRWKMQMP